MSLYRDHGIVLRTYKLGEADRIVVFATAARGKVRAVAKGVRKTRSKFGARLEPTSHVAAQFYEGRELDIVTQVEAVDVFGALRDDLERFARASMLLEAVDQVLQEGEPRPDIYKMLLGALRTLASGNSPLVVPAFFLKLLSVDGVEPVLDRCVECGAEGPLVSFDAHAGGTRCDRCRRGMGVSPETLVLARRVLGGGLASVLAEPPSATTHDLDHLATVALEAHLERRLRSSGVLHQS